ncbi:hypothetical protein ONZ45_g12998 [Pleurotus djamor]|nr:hypothetical protein ONZ45_g12998 [Pleurotus djamor]
MQAICVTSKGTLELRRIPRPTPGIGEAIIKVVAAAQNPSDLKNLFGLKREGSVLGCDFAGVVVELGPPLEGNDLHKVTVGQRVAGFVRGGVDTHGAFAEYVASPVGTLLNVPDSWSFEDAAQVCLAGYTACQCLYEAHSLPTPFDPAPPQPVDILVWGGTTAVGYLVIQLAAMAGLRVITTASPRYTELLKKLGATEVFDYKDPQAGKKIHALTNGRLMHAVDCISEKTTPFQIALALSQEGGTIACLLTYPSRLGKQDINVIMPLAYTVLRYWNPEECPEKRSKQIEFGARAADILNRLMESGKLTPMRKKLYTNGLVDVFDGIAYMTESKVSGEKITYTFRQN